MKKRMKGKHQYPSSLRPVRHSNRLNNSRATVSKRLHPDFINPCASVRSSRDDVWSQWDAQEQPVSVSIFLILASRIALLIIGHRVSLGSKTRTEARRRRVLTTPPTRSNSRHSAPLSRTRRLVVATPTTKTNHRGQKWGKLHRRAELQARRRRRRRRQQHRQREGERRVGDTDRGDTTSLSAD